MIINPTIIGKNCQMYRRSIGYNQTQVANDLGYTMENISHFERGINCNYRILLWYIKKGLPLDYILKGVNYGDN